MLSGPGATWWLAKARRILLKLVGDGIVVGRRRDNGDIVKVLGGRADHRRSADIDVLDQLFEGNSRLGGSFFEGVEVDDYHVDWGDAVLGHSGDMSRVFAAMQDAAVNSGMEGLDAPVKHLGESGEFGNIFDGHAGVAQQFGGASGGDEFHSERGELAGEIYESGFVGNGEDGALDFGIIGHRPLEMVDTS